MKKNSLLIAFLVLIMTACNTTKNTTNSPNSLQGEWVFRAFAFKLVILILCKRHYQKLSVVFDFSISDTFSLGLAS